MELVKTDPKDEYCECCVEAITDFLDRVCDQPGQSAFFKFNDDPKIYRVSIEETGWREDD